MTEKIKISEIIEEQIEQDRKMEELMAGVFTCGVEEVEEIILGLHSWLGTSLVHGGEVVEELRRGDEGDSGGATGY